jgi:uncharacterized protein YjbI with pentapeptide repeats
MANAKKRSKNLLRDETYLNIWHWLKKKTQGYRIILTFLALIIIIILVIGLALMVVNTSSWPQWTGLSKKSAWDLADLLLVPLVLGLIAYIFSQKQKNYEQDIASQARRLEREIARERVEERTIQNYFDKMTELLLKENLRSSEEEAEVHSIARSRTLAVLRDLSDIRKGKLLRFLHESKLIDADHKIIDLRTADLSGANLSGANLYKTNLSGANLSQADLSRAYLRWANLSEADLSNTNLSEADLSEANLNNTNLSRANLCRADLSKAHLILSDLNQTDLSQANLSQANLSLAILRQADLGQANLHRTEYDGHTQWPDDFDPEQAGAIKVKR